MDVPDPMEITVKAAIAKSVAEQFRRAGRYAIDLELLFYRMNITFCSHLAAEVTTCVGAAARQWNKTAKKEMTLTYSFQVFIR